MGKLIIHNSVTVNGAFESPAPDAWLELDNDSADASLEQLVTRPCARCRRSTAGT
jgi:hypothetical protein